MRKLVLSTFLALPALLFAECLSLDEAQSIAEDFFSNAQPSMYKSAAEAPQVNFIWDGEEPVYRRSAASEEASTVNDPSFYVFNKDNGKGFVIVSGESETVQPILGYSLDQSFEVDNMPANLYNWMMGYRQDIQLARENFSSYKSSAVKLEKVQPIEPIKLLETAQWDQDAPYNSKLPSEHKYVTGCGATATCIIMRYHQWPDKGVGTIPTVNEFIGPVELGHTYDWTKMPLKYTKQATPEEQLQVGTLMRDVGVMLRTMYSEGDEKYEASSGARVDEFLPRFLPVFFRYNAKTIRQLNKEQYAGKDEEWHKLMRNEIDNNRPVLYNGDNLSGTSGHAFVLDGYAAQNYYHFNWGWSGEANGYFLLTVMDPEWENEDGSKEKQDLRFSQSAIIGIQPDETNPGGGNYILLEYSRAKGAKKSGIFVDSPVIKQNEEFQLKLEKIVNRGTIDFKGLISVLHMGADPEKKNEICETLDFSKNPIAKNDSITISVTAKVEGKIEKGDFITAMYFDLLSFTGGAVYPGDTYADSCVNMLDLKEEVYSSASDDESVVPTVRVMADAGKIQVEGLNEKTSIFVYSISGQLVASKQTDSSAKFELPADQIYIVKVGDQSWKLKL